MKIKIYQTEWYPVYEVEDSCSELAADTIDAPYENVVAWRSAFGAFDDAQSELRALYEKQHKSK